MNSGMNTPGPSNDEYETPDWLFKALDSEFGLEHDGAATPKNAKCATFTSAHTEPAWPTAKKVFCNPPYSMLDTFVTKAFNHYSALVVLILPNRTDTEWFQRLQICPDVELRYFRKRVRFCLDGKPADSPRFGTVIAIIYPRD